MDFDREYLKGLVYNGSENLSIEIKSWFDPDTPYGIAKIAKSTLALRNNDGGFLIIGLNNDSGTPDTENIPQNIHETFHPDKIQSIVGKYGSEHFEIQVEYIERDSFLIPVICVPGNIKTPVVSKSELRADDGRILVGVNKLYVRSLSSNNTVSTTEIQYRDWERLLSICFDNREADIGRFIRRHLSSIGPETLHTILSSFSENITPKKSQEEVVLENANEGFRRFKHLIKEKNYTLPDVGFFEVSFVINGNVPALSANREFLNLISANNPSLTGWPLWVDSRGFRNQDSHPFVNSGAWEAILFDLNSGWSSHIDYWFIKPSGAFYHIRVLEDDLKTHDRKPDPSVALDFGLPIWRVGEAIAVALSFSKGMGCEEESTAIDFLFRWTRLRNRALTSWAQPARYISPSRTAYQDEVVSYISVPLETPSSAIFEHVYKVTSSLYEVFDGFQLSKSVVEEIVNEMLKRR